MSLVYKDMCECYKHDLFFLNPVLEIIHIPIHSLVIHFYFGFLSYFSLCAYVCTQQ